MSWTWRLLGLDGGALAPPPAFADQVVFPSQADAETWVGQTWRELTDAGVDAVTLLHGDVVVYGPMSLRPAGD